MLPAQVQADRDLVRAEQLIAEGRHEEALTVMDFWQILVLAVLKQGLNCDYDRLKELADQHATIREMLGLGPLDRTRYSLQRLIDNVGHLGPELPKKINRIVVGYGHEVLGCAEDPFGQVKWGCPERGLGCV